MAHFAILDETDKVIEVICISNEAITDSDGNESEGLGKNHIKKIMNEFYPGIKESQIVQTSINNNIRKRYASVGFFYNRIHDAFIQPKFYKSWIFDENTLGWIPPIPPPKDAENYYWNEIDKNWEKNPPPTDSEENL